MADADTRLLDVLATLNDLHSASEAQAYERRKNFKPYPKQLAFFAAGAEHRERMLTAGNQLGKTEGGAYETMCHLTGEYPDWWPGRRFTRPPRGWLCGESSLAARDIIQAKLCGPPGVEAGLGTGLIPRAAFADQPTLARGVTDAFDTIFVKHASGGISRATFKSYEQGRKKFQGEPVDFIWCDEEPPMDIYSECLTRTTATRGMIYTTFTPLQGRTELYSRFADEGKGWMVTMRMADVTHISPEDRDKLLADYPVHERESRANGEPIRGSGRIFPYPDEMIMEPALEYIPPHWLKLWSVDFGIGHPFAAVLNLYDKDNDVIHVHACIRIKDQLPIMHAAAMKPIGSAVPVAWPHDGNRRVEGGDTAQTLRELYRREGLLMLGEHATWPDGGYSTEAGILEMQQRMQTNRYKVANHLGEWFEEFREYHRKDGMIVRLRDDLMSASRIGVMARRHGRQVPLGHFGSAERPSEQLRFNPDGTPYLPEKQVAMARDLDYDLWRPNG